MYSEYMASGMRQFEIGGVYHLFNRGYDKRQIYLDDNDYLRFIECLYYFNTQDEVSVRIRDVRQVESSKAYSRTFQRDPKQAKKWKPLVELMGFTLMPNHYHLIVREIVQGGISLYMQRMGNGYTGYFNIKYDRGGTGGIFQSRYRCVRIESDSQLVNIFSYVHTNPVELIESRWKDLIVKNPHGAVDWLERYWQSSYLDYIGLGNFPNVTQRDFFLELFGGEKYCKAVVEDWIKFKAQNAKLDPKIVLE